MIKTFLRILIHLFSKFIKTDDLSDKFPVSVKAIIIDEGRVLCLKNERNEWDLPGGKINFGEDPEDCLKREIKEETNLEISDLQVLKSLNLRFNNIPVLILLFSAKITSNDPVNISFEHSEYKFFYKSDIKNLNILKNYKEIIVTLL